MPASDHITRLREKTAYDATVRTGVPAPDGDETTEVGWFSPAEMAAAELGPFARAMLRELALT